SPRRRISSRGSWLVVAFSLLSKATATSREAGTSAIPWLATLLSSHSRTISVRSIVTNEYFAPARTGTPPIPPLPSRGVVTAVSVLSVQGLRTTRTSKKPGAPTRFTHRVSVALATSVPWVPLGTAVRSNLRKVTARGAGAWTSRDGSLPKFFAWAADEVWASSASVASTADAGGASAVTATRASSVMPVSLRTNILRATVLSITRAAGPMVTRPGRVKIFGEKRQVCESNVVLLDPPPIGFSPTH